MTEDEFQEVLRIVRHPVLRIVWGALLAFAINQFIGSIVVLLAVMQRLT